MGSAAQPHHRDPHSDAMYHVALLLRIPVMAFGALIAGWLYTRAVWAVVTRSSPVRER